MGKKIRFCLVLMLICSFVLGSAFWSDFSTLASDAVTLNTFVKVYYLVGTSYVDNVEGYKMITGAYTGINAYLKSKKLPQENIPAVKAEDTNPVNTFVKEYNKVLGKYGSRVEKDKLIHYSITGMLGSLKDPYTIFLTAKQFRVFKEQMSGGNFTGIGIYMELDKKNHNQLTVLEPIEGTPAYKAGLKSGDQILKIDGHSTKGMDIDTVATKIRGPSGSTVVITIKRKGVSNLLEFRIVRAFIHVNSVTGKVINKNIGYVKIRMFGEDTGKEMTNALKLLEERGVKSYILDLRNNGGGYIQAAFDVSSKFLPKGTKIVVVKGRGGVEQSYKADGSYLGARTIVILVNNFTASSSEITAGALQDAGVAYLIGVKTFGKGLVQTIRPLSEGGAVKFTSARYYTPNGRDIDKKGIQPDKVIKMSEKNVGEFSKDIQLQEAIKYIRSKMGSHFTVTSKAKAH